jgi:hypothetical protein
VNERAVVIQRGNELSEFVDLLNELAVPTEIHRDAMPTPEDLSGAAVTVVPGSRLVEADPNLAQWPRTIAVVDDSSKTLVSHLNRLGAAMVIRRPIHPRTLRLLLLHEIYRGPERRRRKRVLIGHPIHVSVGLFKHRATLLELSPTGARIELSSTPKIGSKIRIVIGKDLTQGKPIKLHAKVIRCIRPENRRGREDAEIGIALLDAKSHQKAIQGILERFVRGPAAWSGKITPSEVAPRMDTRAASPAPEVNDPTLEAYPGESERSLPRSFSAKKLPPSFGRGLPTPHEIDGVSTEAVLPEAESNALNGVASPESSEASCKEALGESLEAPDSESSSDRRSHPRIPYDRRVVALDEEAARVLVGRDLSHGGMRIAANETISTGHVLRIALHCGINMEPLVVLARALRNDGEDGIVLTFDNLSAGQRDHLDKIIASSSPIRAVTEENGATDQDGDAIVLGEMLETVECAEPLLIVEDDEIDRHLDSIFDTSESVENTR